MKKLFVFIVLLISLSNISCQSPKEKAIQSVDETLKYLNTMQGGVTHFSKDLKGLLLNFKYYLFTDWKLEAANDIDNIYVTAFVTKKNGFGVESHDKVTFKIDKKDYTIRDTEGLFALDVIPSSFETTDLEIVNKWNKEKPKITIGSHSWSYEYGVCNFSATIINGSEYILKDLNLEIEFYDDSRNIVGTESTTVLKDSPLIRFSERRVSWICSYPAGATKALIKLKFD